MTGSARFHFVSLLLEAGFAAWAGSLAFAGRRVSLPSWVFIGTSAYAAYWTIYHWRQYQAAAQLEAYAALPPEVRIQTMV